jgi:DNA repair protein RecN (Recombination protein N)
MLQSLHVKNLALMEETEVFFGPGLNILTGETGAGKSLLIGSVSLALGGKFDPAMLRKGAENAFVEMVFEGEDARVSEKLREMDLEPEEDGTVIISRRMAPGKSTCKINGETVTARQIRELAEVLIDIHGQHEHETLLHKSKHLDILDAFCGGEAAKLLEEVAGLHRELRKLEEELEGESRDTETLSRESALAEFELKEITEAQLKSGEDEELERNYRRMVNSQKIMEGLSGCYSAISSDEEGGAGNALSHGLRALRSISAYDEALSGFEEQLTQVDDLLSDLAREISQYMADAEFDEELFRETEDRLNLINHLKDKYGRTIEEVLAYADSRQELLDKYSDYDAYPAGLKAKIAEASAKLDAACEKLSKVRKKGAKEFTEQLKDALLSLNFLSVEFEVSCSRLDHPTAKGADDVEFLISTNPGESIKPLQNVASGGELSRVMLAVKTVMAGKDHTGTLIFDEIDAGISGRTAWKVSEQLGRVSAGHQVICITHLPQIAAMADTHFVIEKSSDGAATITDIRKADEAESLAELARLLGSDEVTESALQNARELRNQARQGKRA